MRVIGVSNTHAAARAAGRGAGPGEMYRANRKKLDGWSGPTRRGGGENFQDGDDHRELIGPLFLSPAQSQVKLTRPRAYSARFLATNASNWG